MLTTVLSSITYAASGLTVYTTDTVAGYGTLIRITNAPSNENIDVQVKKPDGSHVAITVETDQFGKGKADLEGFYTKSAGKYEIMAHSEHGTQSQDQFRVYPDVVSPNRSTLFIDQQTAAANGNDFVELRVDLKDKYNNPVPGHTVQILSSRTEDEIVRISSQSHTNEQGRLLYHLYSKEAGVSTFLAHDSTENVTINNRAKVAFYAPSQPAIERGGEFIYLASETGPVSYLSIENINENIQTGESLNATVSAYDNNGDIVGDYTGTVRFSATDNNASLPNDYLFEAADQGSHTFSLGLSLQTPGTHTLTVTDINNPDIFGEKEVAVSNRGTGQSTTSSNNTSNQSPAGINLYTPAPGTYSSSTISFSGQATYGQTIKIMDNGLELASTLVTPDGEFSHVATGLSEGEHTFLIQAFDANGSEANRSNEILVNIDTSAPQLDNLESDHNGEIEAGDIITLTAYTESNLPQVAVILNNGIFEMTEDLLIDGIYTAQLSTPETPGDYSLDVLLVDELGNETIYSDQLTLRVIEATPTEEIEEEEEEIIEEEIEEEETDPLVLYPGQVMAVEAQAGDSRVTLTWEEPHEWVDMNGNMIEEITPIQEIPLTEEETANFEEELNNMSEEELEAFFDEFAAGIEEALTETVEENPEALLQSEEDEELTIEHYRIYFGPDSELMYSTVDTWDNRTTWYIPDLPNGSEYFFSVVAVDSDGKESPLKSNIVSATPESDDSAALFAAAAEEAERQAEIAAREAALATSMSEAATPETGPEILWLILLTGALSYGYTHRGRKPKTVPFRDIR